MNSYIKKNGLGEQVLLNIPKGSVIIIENTYYRSCKVEKAPTMSSKISRIKKWLLSKNTAFEGGVTCQWEYSICPLVM